MPKTSNLLMAGLIMGLIGALTFNRLRAIKAEEDADQLLGRICDHLLQLEIAKADEASLILVSDF